MASNRPKAGREQVGAARWSSGADQEWRRIRNCCGQLSVVAKRSGQSGGIRMHQELGGQLSVAKRSVGRAANQTTHEKSSRRKTTGMGYEGAGSVLGTYRVPYGISTLEYCAGGRCALHR